jgi:cytochrome c biogenesis protein CcmG, thiol:disulfide interchange protein DsbE
MERLLPFTIQSEQRSAVTAGVTDKESSRGRNSETLKLPRRRVLPVLPILALGGVATIFMWGISRDPSKLPSTMIGKPVPKFALPPVQGRTLGLSSDDLRGEVSLVNVFASWCVACREEHPIFMRLARDRTVPIHGINYKDDPDNAAAWLNTFGDPYTRTGADRNGRVAIDWGVYGIPETFVVSADGRIAHKQIGAVTEQSLTDIILPLIARLRREPTGGKS